MVPSPAWYRMMRDVCHEGYESSHTAVVDDLLSHETRRKSIRKHEYPVPIKMNRRIDDVRARKECRRVERWSLKVAPLDPESQTLRQLQYSSPMTISQTL